MDCKSIKEVKIFDCFMIIFIIISILLNASYFPYAYISLLVILFFALLIKKDKILYISHSGVSVSFISFGVVYTIIGLASSNFESFSVLEVLKIIFSMLFFIAVIHWNNRGAFFTGVWLGSFIVAMLGILSYLGIIHIEGSLFNDNGLLRLQSLVQYANTTALIMAIGYYITSYHRSNTLSRKKRIIGISIEYLLLICLILTFSRLLIFFFISLSIIQIYFTKGTQDKITAIIEIPISIIIGLVMSTRLITNGNGLISFLILSVLISIAVFFDGFLYNLLTRNNKKNPALKVPFIIYISIYVICAALILSGKIPWLINASGTLTCRLTYMKDALIAIFQNPFSGVGAGAWTYKQSIYQTSPYSIRYIHNSLLQIALDSGIVALTLFMIAIVLFYKDVLSRVIRGAESFDITVFLIVSLTLLHSILDVDLSFPAVFNVLAGCLAIITQNKS